MGLAISANCDLCHLMSDPVAIKQEPSLLELPNGWHIIMEILHRTQYWEHHFKVYCPRCYKKHKKEILEPE